MLYTYRAEFDEAEVIFNVLPEIPSEDDWDILMTMLRDNIVHMVMLERALRLLNYEPPELQPRIQPKILVSDRNSALEFIAKFEQSAYNHCRYLLKKNGFQKRRAWQRNKKTL